MIAFDAISIPVKLYTLVEPKRIRFREVRLSDGAAIKHLRVGARSGREIPAGRIAKGFEREDGQIVILNAQQLAAAAPPPSKTIKIEQFTPANQIDPILYEHPYILTPQPGGQQAYTTLRAALIQTRAAGIGRIVMRSREQIAALAAYDNLLRLYTLRFADQLLPDTEIEPPAATRKPTKPELRIARQLINTLHGNWQPALYQDDHRRAILQLINHKAAGATRPPSPPAKTASATPDLLAALKASIERHQPQRPHRPRHQHSTLPAPDRRRSFQPGSRS